jgi:hypothetical protein
VQRGDVYAGISGVTLEPESFDLGDGVVLSRTYAHLMSPCLMAFAPPGPHGHHPAPWRAATGGFAFDIEIEMKVPTATTLSEHFETKEIIWWIATLLRLTKSPFLTVPVLSDQPFNVIPKIKEEPRLDPFEIEPRIFRTGESSGRSLGMETLNYVKEKWVPAALLLSSNAKFYAAIKAFDSATVRGRASASLLALWGAIEQIFAPSRAELRYRVSSLLASYLEPHGKERLKLYKEILMLYDERSVAAHTAQQVDSGPLVHTYVLMRNALIRMIDEHSVPTQDDLEKMLFDAPAG